MKRVFHKLFTIGAIASIALTLVLTSCKKDTATPTLTITADNIAGTWVNSSDNITLIIAPSGIGTYESDYYSNPPETITWGISDDGLTLSVQGTSTFFQQYNLTSETTIEETTQGTVLTKQ